MSSFETGGVYPLEGSRWSRIDSMELINGNEMADGTCTKSGIDGCRLALNLSLVFTHGYHHLGNALVCRKQCPTAPFLLLQECDRPNAATVASVRRRSEVSLEASCKSVETLR